MTENKNSKNKSLSKRYTISTQLKLNSVAKINLQHPNNTILTDINSELKDIPVDLDLIKTITEFKIRNNEFVNSNGWNRKYYAEFNDRYKKYYNKNTWYLLYCSNEFQLWCVFHYGLAIDLKLNSDVSFYVSYADVAGWHIAEIARIADISLIYDCFKDVDNNSVFSHRKILSEIGQEQISLLASEFKSAKYMNIDHKALEELFILDMINYRAKESFKHETEFNDSMYELIENKLDALYSDNNIRRNLFNVVHGLKWITNLDNSVVLD